MYYKSVAISRQRQERNQIAVAAKVAQW